MQYAFSADRMLPSETNLIPLFGIGKLQTLHFDDNYHAEVGTVHLLRAFAKVEVIKKRIARSTLNGRAYIVITILDSVPLEMSTASRTMCTAAMTRIM